MTALELLEVTRNFYEFLGAFISYPEVLRVPKNYHKLSYILKNDDRATHRQSTFKQIQNKNIVTKNCLKENDKKVIFNSLVLKSSSSSYGTKISRYWPVLSGKKRQAITITTKNHTTNCDVWEL